MSRFSTNRRTVAASALTGALVAFTGPATRTASGQTSSASLVLPA